MSQPRVSAVVTFYNHARFVDETLDSVLAQTYPNLEVIAVDDGSTDDTPVRLAHYDGRVRVIRHPENLGLARNAEGAPARNTGASAATGDYVAFLDGDDLWEPEKIAAQVDAALRHPEAGLVATDGVSFMDADGTQWTDTLLLDAKLKALPPGAVVVEDLYLRAIHGCPFDTPSQVMIPQSTFDAIGYFTECRSEDYDFYLRVAARFPIAIVKAPLVRYRLHEANLTGALDNLFLRFVQPNLDIWYRHLEVCPEDVRPVVLRQIRHHQIDGADRAAADAQEGHRDRAARFLSHLLRENPVTGASAYVAYQRVLVELPPTAQRALDPVTRRVRRRLRG